VIDRFFDRFRTAMARLPAGLIRVGPPATPDELSRATSSLGAPLPDVYASFLRSFDGADLFNETVVIAGVGSGAFRALDGVAHEGARAGDLVFAEAQVGDRFALDGAGRVLRYDEAFEERALAGSDFGAWLAATVAREQVLYGTDGEYAPDVFDSEGEEVLPRVALRQAERALKADPGSADAEHARGLALAHLGRRADALTALSRATALFPENPWPWFDLGRVALEHGQGVEALAAFRRAAAGEAGPQAARFLAWAARAALAGTDPDAVPALRAEALAQDPDLTEGLRRAAESAAADGDQPAQAEAVALLEAIAPGTTPRRRLPVITSDALPVESSPRRGGTSKAVSGPAARPPRPGRPPRPRPAAPPRSGGSRRGRSR
jgi:hypothetical protein